MSKLATWDDILSLWLHSKPASTVYVYKPVITGLRNFAKNVPPQEIDLRTLQGYLEQCGKKQKPATIKRKICTIRSLFTYARRIGAIERNPADALETPHIPDELANKILVKKDILRIIAAADEGRDRTLVTLLYSAGIRASEASNLKWGDCRVRPGNKDGIISVLGKGQKRRSIRLTPEVWQQLMTLRPADSSREDFVFLSESGFKKPLWRTRITDIVKAAAKKAGLEQHVSAHWMRHGHATHAMENGAPLALISSTLGHTELSTTARYLHVSPDKSSTAYVSLSNVTRETKPKF